MCIDKEGSPTLLAHESDDSVLSDMFALCIDIYHVPAKGKSYSLIVFCMFCTIEMCLHLEIIRGVLVHALFNRNLILSIQKRKYF
jgi:hypothetical protein